MIPVYYCEDICNIGNNMHKNLIIALFNSPMAEVGGGGGEGSVEATIANWFFKCFLRMGRVYSKQNF